MREIDAEFQKARQVLGPDKIIGVTASSTEEALRACEAGATYLGVGTVYATQTYALTLSSSLLTRLLTR